ncbi:MAG: hypothetical protein ACRDYB_16975, partial [Acidimicrobiales bacterium]
MRRRIVTIGLACSIAVGGSLALWPPGAFAADGSGGYTSASAQASGGQLTVEAGQTYWMPPTGSRWASAAKSDPPPGKPNPDQPYGCTYKADPTAQQTLGTGGPTPGEWLVVTCSGPGAVDPMPLMWVTNAAPAVVTAEANPVLVGMQAVRQLGLTSPSIEMAPPDGAAQLVGVPTWLWIAPGAWRTLVASASAGAVAATATAMPTKVVWEMGDGASVTCVGPGTPYVASAPDATTDCSYTWGEPGSYTVTATLYWS